MTSPKPNSQAGFTVIETLVALVLITIVMMGTLAMQVGVVRTSTASRSTSAAMALIQARLEEFRALRFDRIVAGADTRCFDRDSQEAAACPGLYTRTATIAPFGAGFTITVQVQWTTQDGVQQATMSLEREP